MKQSQKIINERYEEIIQLLQAQPNLSLTVQEIADHLAVSPMTIRRDLTKLESMGKLVRHHGSAALNEKPSSEGNTFNTHIERIKDRLAIEASKYITDQSTLFVNSSSTALMSLRHLGDRNLTVVTNNAHVTNLPHMPNLSIVLSGGEVRLPKEALVGDLALSTLRQVQADMTIMGCSGLSLERGISTINFHEAAVNSQMIENTRHKVIVVADYRKIGTDANFPIASLTQIDLLITDTHADQHILNQVEALGIKVIQVPL